jgi:serine/threonine protein phosphatase PrpC
MGNQLINPIVTKATSLFSGNGISAGISGMQGFRKDMEDTHIATTIPNFEDHTIFAVFDGHCGDATAKYAEKHFVETLAKSPEWLTYIATQSADHLMYALTNCFIRLDSAMRINPDILASGCTAVVVIVAPRIIVCANAGDSRAIMSQIGDKNAIALSEDHKPENPAETARIKQNGGFVQNNRVNGTLAVSRGLGDFDLKQNPQQPLVSCLPEFVVRHRNYEQDEFILVACDGLWDVYKNNEAIEELRAIVKEGERDICLIAEEMLDMSLHRGSNDNISAIVVKLSSFPYNESGGGGAGVAERRAARQRASNVSSDDSS